MLTRYDERMLSNTKLSFMYTPGNAPVTFVVDGVCFGCALGMETHYPEIFMAYERLGVDCILFSTTGETPSAAAAFAAEVQGHAASNALWVSYAAHARQSVVIPAGIASPDGTWAGQCATDGTASIAVADLSIESENAARPWRRKARDNLYATHHVNDDARSEGRDVSDVPALAEDTSHMATAAR